MPSKPQKKSPAEAAYERGFAAGYEAGRAAGKAEQPAPVIVPVPQSYPVRQPCGRWWDGVWYDSGTGVCSGTGSIGGGTVSSTLTILPPDEPPASAAVPA